MIIGSFFDGRKLEYDEPRYQFFIGGQPASIAEMKQHDALGEISWNLQSQHEWLASVDNDAFEEAHAHVLEEVQQAGEDGDKPSQDATEQQGENEALAAAAQQEAQQTWQPYQKQPWQPYQQQQEAQQPAVPQPYQQPVAQQQPFALQQQTQQLPYRVQQQQPYWQQQPYRQGQYQQPYQQPYYAQPQKSSDRKGLIIALIAVAAMLMVASIMAYMVVRALATASMGYGMGASYGYSTAYEMQAADLPLQGVLDVGGMLA